MPEYRYSGLGLKSMVFTKGAGNNPPPPPPPPADDPPPPPRPPARMFNPRWSHVDPKRKEESPNLAAFGDEILIEIDTENIGNGPGIYIIITDEGADPPHSPWQTERKKNVTVKNNLLSLKWKVLREKYDGKTPDYRFNARYSGVYGKAHIKETKIPVKKPVFTDDDVLHIERTYHDNEPVQNAPFEVAFADATIAKGTLDATGRANIGNITIKPEKIRFEPDARQYKLVNQTKNIDYKATFTQSDADALVAKAQQPTAEPEKKSIVADSIQWVCGTLQGSFNQKQSVSQIIVDAMIGMVPIVGDVTAVRDLTAVTIGLSLDEKKREDKFQWLTLVLLLFALIPVIGGAIKGIGRLLIKGGKQASHIADFIAALNRLGVGNAVSFIKNLDLTKYTADLLGKWRELLQRLDKVISAAQKNLSHIIPKAYLDRLDTIQEGLEHLMAKGEKMIPESVKELNAKLETVQREVYSGEWHAIPTAMKSTTKEIEARLVKTVEGNEKWVVDRMEFPPSKKADFISDERWPDLTQGKFVKVIEGQNGEDITIFEKIETFSGPIRKVKLPPGTKIYRVIQHNRPNDGLFWCYKLPTDGESWRKDFAVLESWSENGSYIEYVVEEPGLYVLEGKVASQIENAATADSYGQYLGGGGTQVLVDFSHKKNSSFKKNVLALEKKPTNWGTSHRNVNVPEKGVTVNYLKPQEVAAKVNLGMINTYESLKSSSEQK